MCSRLQPGQWLLLWLRLHVFKLVWMVWMRLCLQLWLHLSLCFERLHSWLHLCQELLLWLRLTARQLLWKHWWRLCLQSQLHLCLWHVHLCWWRRLSMKLLLWLWLVVRQRPLRCRVLSECFYSCLQGLYAILLHPLVLLLCPVDLLMMVRMAAFQLGSELRRYVLDLRMWNASTPFYLCHDPVNFNIGYLQEMVLALVISSLVPWLDMVI